MIEQTPPPLVSVVIVNYNGGHFLLETVQAVMTSTVAIEVLVVDNGSTDHSVSDVRRFFTDERRLQIIENGDNLGFARANNIALAQSRGRYLLILNPDCIVKPDTLARMIGALEADPRAGMAGCLIQNPDGSEQPGCRRSIPTPWTGLLRALHLGRLAGKDSPVQSMDLVHNPLPETPVYVDAISGAFMLIRREALEAVGLMDEGYFLHCEDLDWCKAFQEAGWQILFVPQVFIMHHKGVCSTNRPIFVLWHKHRGMARFYRKFLSRRYPLPLNLLVLLGVWARFAVMVPLEMARRLPLRFARRAAAPAAPPPDRPSPQQAMFTELRGRRVLVSGGTGFIGRRLVDELLRQGARVSVLTRHPERIATTWQGDVEAVRGDLENADSLSGVCEGVETVFHLASCAHMLDLPAADDARHRQVTEQGTVELLKQARTAGVKRFVFVSSVKAMGEEHEHCLDENSPATPVSAYGIAKLHAEQAVLAWADGGMSATVLRLPMVYGPGNKGNLPRMIDAIGQGRFPPLPEVRNRRSMVHVDDVVQALLLAAVKPQAAGQTYIVTDDHDYSTATIHRLIMQNLGRRPPRWHMPMPVLKAGARCGDLLMRFGVSVPLYTLNLRKLLGSACYSNHKIRDELGFIPRHDLQQAMPEMVAEALQGPVAGDAAGFFGVNTAPGSQVAGPATGSQNRNPP